MVTEDRNTDDQATEFASSKVFAAMNAGYVADLIGDQIEESSDLNSNLRAPDGVNTSLDGTNGTTRANVLVESMVSPEQLLRVGRLVAAIRRDGHQAASIDPLGLRPRREEHLRPEQYGVTESTLGMSARWLVEAHDQEFPWLAARTIGDAIDQLKRNYCGSIGFEFDHIHDVEERNWLQDQVESQSAMSFMADSQKIYLLGLLSRVEAFEKYLHSAFTGRRWYGLEGLESLVTLIDQIILQSTFEVEQIVLGMAHRGRLNVLAHILDQPYDQLINGFLEGRFAHLAELEASGWMTDVKYHLGSRAARDVDQDGITDIQLRLLPNPSHLGMVVPVVLGAVRSIQDRTPAGGDAHLAAMGLIIHGDAAFAGQGIVHESLNLTNLDGYSVGGAIHIIANNQLGFTTEPQESYSGDYASDVARGYEVPVVHVNAEDMEACMLVAKMAVAYRLQFRKEFVIDLVGYRRHGHNENDEPTFTQPTMYQAIADRPSLREQWANRLVDGEVVTRADAETMYASTIEKLRAVMEAIESSGVVNRHEAPSNLELAPEPLEGVDYPDTAVEHYRLNELNRTITTLPESFSVHPTIERVFERRSGAFDGDGAEIDWAHAEALALGSILQDGVGVRLTGQDCERGTFSQRHATVVDVKNGERYAPLSNVEGAPFWVYNSPLSELGPVGYEHGYSVLSENTLVLWEAQFGDFANNAQSMIDEMVVSAYEKWGQRSNLVLLLPHGYEGQGPNHSHAYIERFLSLASWGNIRVTYPTTSSQYFHLLRTQAASLNDLEHSRPLIVMTPKSLLRHPLAACSPLDLTEGRFEPIRRFVFSGEDPEEIKRVVVCSGKIFVDLGSHPDVAEASGVGVVVLDELHPFPDDSLMDAFNYFSGYEEVVWLQEEPMNRGAWEYVRAPISALTGKTVRYVGRPRSASPASGSNWLHRLQQDRLIRLALGLSPGE